MNTHRSPFFESTAAPDWATRASLAVTRGTPETANRWAHAVPHMRITQKVSEWDRWKLVAKAREEYLENAHASGIVETIVRGTVGRLPTFHLRTSNSRLNRWFVLRLMNWVRTVRLEMICRVACRSLVVDGESFIQFTSDPSVPGFPVRPVPIDSQRIRNPQGRADGPFEWDGDLYLLREGILYDGYMNPRWYCVLNVPELSTSSYDSTKFVMVPAECMAHMYEQIMAEQLRGFSWLMQGLEKLGRISDFSDAVSENAKNSAAIIATTSSRSALESNFQQGVAAEPYVTGASIPFVRNEIVCLTPDSDFNSFTPGQPLAQHEPYMKYEVSAVGHGMGVPRHLSLGSSAECNFASGKLDSYRFDETRWMVHGHFEIGLFGWIVSRMYDAWYRPIILRRHGTAPLPGRQRMEYRWPMQPEIDSAKAATTDQIRLQMGLVTRRDLIDRDGGDYESTYRQWKREQRDWGQLETIGEKIGTLQARPEPPIGPSIEDHLMEDHLQP